MANVQHNDKSYSYKAHGFLVTITRSQDGMSAPVTYAARALGCDWVGYGTTEAEAVVDMLRLRRGFPTGGA